MINATKFNNSTSIKRPEVLFLLYLPLSFLNLPINLSYSIATLVEAPLRRLIKINQVEAVSQKIIAGLTLLDYSRLFKYSITADRLFNETGTVIPSANSKQLLFFLKAMTCCILAKYDWCTRINPRAFNC